MAGLTDSQNDFRKDRITALAAEHGMAEIEIDAFTTGYTEAYDAGWRDAEEAQQARIADLERERDQARNAILKLGNDQNFDWKVLGCIDDLEQLAEAVLQFLAADDRHDGDTVKLAEMARTALAGRGAGGSSGEGA